MTIEPGPVPLWVQLAVLIRKRVENGTYPPGTPVPSISRLAAEHGIAPGTVRKALDSLKADGTLTATPGLGTFVAGP